MRKFCIEYSLIPKCIDEKWFVVKRHFTSNPHDWFDTVESGDFATREDAKHYCDIRRINFATWGRVPCNKYISF